MRYIRTKNGVIIDLEKFINNEKDTPYYTDFIFDEITKDGNLKWTAVGTDKNTMENQRGRRCQFGATLNSKIIKQADTIEELCDEFDWKWNEKEFPYSKVRQHSRYGGYGDLERAMKEEENYGKHLNHDYEIYGAIWTDKGLIYVAKMNEKGILKLL